MARALATFDFPLRHRVENLLDRIEAPVLVVRSEFDPICRQPWAERVAHELPRGELVVIPEVAHPLVFTSPDELASATRAFLETL